VSPRQKLSVLIPAGNEERHIAECIASARFADEVVVVVDAASADRTAEIARTAADRVLVHEYVNSAAQKNWALPQVSHPWVLVVDADERVTPELRRDIESVLERDGPEDGYRIHRLNHFMGQAIRGCGWQRDDVLRLFRRDKGRYEDKHVHADIIFPDHPGARVGRLGGRFLHFTYESFDHYLNKFVRYTQWAGEDRDRRTARLGWRHLALRPAWRFFRQFVLFGGWRDGKTGFIICMMAAFSVFLKYARVWEKRRLAASGKPGPAQE
jgi:glycosyltransferase involved in cell wall biosynthesis